MQPTDLDSSSSNNNIAARRQLEAELLAAASASETQLTDTQLIADATPQSDDNAQLVDAVVTATPMPTNLISASPATTVAAATSATTSNAAANAAAPTAVAMHNDSCALDLARFCKREANIVAVLEDMPTNTIDAGTVTRAIESVQQCMARNVESLSTACIESLVADIVEQRQRERHAPAALEAVPATDVNAQTTAEDDSSVDVSVHYIKHHHSATGLRGMDHTAISHTAPAISQSMPSYDSSDFGSPLLWLLVLPFFCIGAYTVYNHAVVYVRRRRDIFRVESKQYAPLP